MTDAPTTPSPERQPADAGGGLWPVGSWLSAALDDPKVCAEMKRDIQEWFDGNGHVRTPAPQAQPDARAVEALRRMERNPVSFSHAASQLARETLQALSALAADDGWQPIESAPRIEVVLLAGFLKPHPDDEHLHCGLDQIKRVTGYWDDVDEAWAPVGSTWVGPWFEPTHWRPLPAPPVALHPAAPTDEVGK